MAEGAQSTGIRVVGRAELAAHKTRETGVWIAIHGEVYDVTNFLDEHPGGPEVILDEAGAVTKRNLGIYER
jgi:cytochrome b involved in lipid metabolism